MVIVYTRNKGVIVYADYLVKKEKFMDIMLFIQKIDNSILIYINNNLRNPITDKIMIVITSLGNMGIIWIILSLLMILSEKYRKIGIIVLIAVLLSTILGEGILKHIVRRLRPVNEILNGKQLIAKPLSYSFPSGHAACAFASAGIIANYIKKYSIAVFTLAVLIGLSRLYLYVHYPTDVLCGAILGLISARIVIYVFENKINYGDENNI